MSIYLIHRDNAILAVVEAVSYKGAIIAHSASEGVEARIASKAELFEYMRLAGVTGPAPPPVPQTSLPFPEPMVVATKPHGVA